MTPYLKAPKGSEQCQDYCTSDNFVRKTAVSQIDRKKWGQKRDLPHFYVNTVLQDQTEIVSKGLFFVLNLGQLLERFFIN